MTTRQEHRLRLAQGELHYAVWGERGPVILASHGLTANHRSFETLARALGRQFGSECRLIAPDHRGRGRSRDISGPWGMSQHAQDLLSLLDALDIPAVDLLIGHSMGGFVGAVTAAIAPERIPRLLLVDGGLPLIDELPAGMSIEGLIASIVGPSMNRLDMRFASAADYHAFWREQPAFAESWNADLEAYLDYDLIGEAPALHATAIKEAIIADVETQLLGTTIPDALRALRIPVRLLTAERGVIDATPLYAEHIIERWAPQISHFSRRHIADVNHLSILMSPTGARAIVGEIRALLNTTEQPAGAIS